jgi:hypothetical protein
MHGVARYSAEQIIEQYGVDGPRLCQQLQQNYLSFFTLPVRAPGWFGCCSGAPVHWLEDPWLRLGHAARLVIYQDGAQCGIA